MFLYLIFIMTFFTALVIFYAILGYACRARRTVDARLKAIAKSDPADIQNELNQPIFTRVFKPILDDISKTLLKITPKEIVAVLEKKVILAGCPLKLSVKDWINIQAVLIVCLPLVTFAAGYYLNADTKRLVLIIVSEISAGILLPLLILNSKAAERKKKILNSLPDVIDLLTVSVEAGLGFDGALAKVIEKMPGPLAYEFDMVLQEMKVGRQKKDALKEMASRINIQDLKTFISSVIQADQLGVSIGNVLRLQSEQIRLKRRQRAQEKAMKAPVKMLIPMVLFIFPTIFSVLLGPVAIRVMDTFFK